MVHIKKSARRHLLVLYKSHRCPQLFIQASGKSLHKTGILLIKDFLSALLYNFYFVPVCLVPVKRADAFDDVIPVF